MIYKQKRIEVRIHELTKEHGISLRELGRLADIDISQLSLLANGKRKRIDFGHIQRIAEALDITDMNKIIRIVTVEDDEN